MAGDDLDVGQLSASPTLFYKRLREFLSDDDAMRVLVEIADTCNGCWDANVTECNCSERGD